LLIFQQPVTNELIYESAMFKKKLCRFARK